MQFKPRSIHPTETCHYCGRTDIEYYGRWVRLAPDDEQKVWFCRSTCSAMEKHELGLCTMEMWLYKDILQKCYPRIYELRFGEKKNNQRNRNQNINQKKKKKDAVFKYNQKKQQKPQNQQKKQDNEGVVENQFEAVA